MSWHEHNNDIDWDSLSFEDIQAIQQNPSAYRIPDDKVDRVIEIICTNKILKRDLSVTRIGEILGVHRNTVHNRFNGSTFTINETLKIIAADGKEKRSGANIIKSITDMFR